MIKFVVVFITIVLVFIFQPANSQNENFVDIKKIIPSIQLDIRYYIDYNFVGQQIEGYNAPKCLLTRDASQALLEVQEELMHKSYSLKVYDCYRPQRSVDHFVRWAQDIDDQKMKSDFYPNVDKQNLFIEGYIADRSSHSRGSTVDLTMVSIPTPPQEGYSPYRTFIDNSIDMGTSFDFFDPSSHTLTSQVDDTQQANRLLLKAVMEKHGFRNYSREWWHYTFINEPFPNTYFDFPIS
ncbi:MAG: M15 family metallopeptidase [Moorea sp. SIO2B7]|nr:M15 family metallopeptidase [Moorena sp. SIO2B7]